VVSSPGRRCPRGLRTGGAPTAGVRAAPHQSDEERVSGPRLLPDGYESSAACPHTISIGFSTKVIPRFALRKPRSPAFDPTTSVLRRAGRASGRLPQQVAGYPAVPQL